MKLNPMQLMSMMRGGQNPQQIAMGLLQSESNNPMMANLMNLANQNDTNGIESFVRNYMNSQGYNFDEEFQKFKSNIGIR